MPVQMIRNNQDGPTVFSPDDNAKRYIEWQGKGDPNGGDIQPVGEDVQQNTQYQKMLRRGVLTIVDESSEDIAAAMDLQQQHWDSRQGAGAAAANEALDHQANNDMVVLPCVGPNPRGGDGKCAADVTVRDSKRNDAPPLCNIHSGLKGEFVPSEENVVDGKVTKTWTRVTMGARQRGE